MLRYGDRMEKSQIAHSRAEDEGLSFREAERIVESKCFLDEYPWWGLGTPHQMVILHEMFLHAAGRGQKEAECMCHWGHQSGIPEPNSEVGQSTMELVGYWTSRREIRDVYHSVYLLGRSPGFPSCRELRRRRTIQDILSSLQTWLQRQTYSTEAEDLDAHGGEWARSDTLQSYKAALQAAHQKALETTEALQNDLERLNNEWRGRSWTYSQSGNQTRTRSRNHSRGHSRNHSSGHLRNHSRGHSQTQAQSQSPPTSIPKVYIPHL